MLKIGDFAKISRVSVKALRYYDEIGLLKPSQIDKFSSYRYYTFDQLPRLNRILALKDLGLSLDQIAVLLDENLSIDEMHGMLRLKQAELQQIVQEEQARLDRVAARLRQIEQEGRLPEYEVILKRVDPMLIAAASGVIPNLETIEQVFGRLFGLLDAHVCSRMAGPPVALYFDMDERQEDIHVEIAYPVQPNTPGTPEITVYDLPGIEAACTIHRGAFDGLGNAYCSLITWIQTSGYRTLSPSREIYLHFDLMTPVNHITEIQIPVVKV
jgi:DNA-binding transcriptional MerR regulator